MSCSQSGIYAIRNLDNGHLYIGSSSKLDQRRRYHFNYLKRGVHDNSHLQRAYDKYGKEMFIFEVLITCHPDCLIWYEQQFLDLLHPEYNIRKLANTNLGIKFSDEICKMMSKIRKGKTGRKHTEETKQKIKLKNKGKIVSEETRLKLHASCLGRKLSEETKLKISAAGKARKLSVIHKQRISDAHIKHHNIKFISPEGNIYCCVSNIKQFVREHKIPNSGAIYDLINGKRRTAYGWKLYMGI